MTRIYVCQCSLPISTIARKAQWDSAIWLTLRTLWYCTNNGVKEKDNIMYLKKQEKQKLRFNFIICIQLLILHTTLEGNNF